MTDTLARMKQLIGSTAEWAAHDIVLGYGEIGIERVSANEYKAKVGDGTSRWSLLPYLTGSAINNAAIQAALDAKVTKAGDTMTGPLVLSGNPTNPLGAATKVMVDDLHTALTGGLAAKLDTAGGSMTGPLALQGNPSTALIAAPKQYVDAGDAAKVSKAGDTMTGPLTLYGAPVDQLEAATKEYVDHGPYQTIVGGTSTYAGKVVKLNAQGLIDSSLVPVGASYFGTVNVTAPYALTGTYIPGNYFSVLTSGTIDPTWATKLNGAPTIASAGQFIIYSTNGRFDLVGETSGGAAISEKLDKSGGTMTGPLILAGDPTGALGAAPKQYVDKMLPLAGGTMTGPLKLSADPATDLDAATKHYVDNKVVGLTGFVAKSGDTMTGPLTMSGDATAALHPMTKQQVDALDAANRAAWAAADAAVTGGYQGALAAKVNKAGDTMTGDLEIGNSNNPALNLHFHGIVWWKASAGGDGSYNLQNSSGAWGMHRSSDGGMYFPGNVVAYWSDARLKEEVQDLTDYEDRIMGLRPVSFQWNEKGRKFTSKAEGQREVGFIAQETQKVCDQYVVENKTSPEDDGIAYLTVQKDQMIADLVAMVKDLNKRVRELEGKQ